MSKKITPAEKEQLEQNEKEADRLKQEDVVKANAEDHELQKEEQAIYEETRRNQVREENTRAAAKHAAAVQSTADALHDAYPPFLKKFLEHLLTVMTDALIDFFFKGKFAAYTAFFLALYILYLIFRGDSSSDDSSHETNNSIRNKRYKDSHKKTWYEKLWDKIVEFFTPGYYIYSLLGKFSPRGLNGGKTSDRNTMSSGRCNGVKWDEDPKKEGRGGTCINHTPPKPIVWNIHVSENIEYNTMKSALKTNFKDTAVVIPYDLNPEASFYVPQCDKMYFENKCRKIKTTQKCKKNEVTVNGNECCEKTNMYIDNGTSCSYAEVQRTLFKK